MFRHVIEVPFTDSTFVHVNYPQEMTKVELAAALTNDLIPSLRKEEIAEGICLYLEGTGIQRLEEAIGANIVKCDFKLIEVVQDDD